MIKDEEWTVDYPLHADDFMWDGDDFCAEED